MGTWDMLRGLHERAQGRHVPSFQEGGLVSIGGDAEAIRSNAIANLQGIGEMGSGQDFLHLEPLGGMDLSWNADWGGLMPSALSGAYDETSDDYLYGAQEHIDPTRFLAQQAARNRPTPAGSRLTPEYAYAEQIDPGSTSRVDHLGNPVFQSLYAPGAPLAHLTMEQMGALWRGEFPVTGEAGGISPGGLGDLPDLGGWGWQPGVNLGGIGSSIVLPGQSLDTPLGDIGLGGVLHADPGFSSRPAPNLGGLSTTWEGGLPGGDIIVPPGISSGPSTILESNLPGANVLTGGGPWTSAGGQTVLGRLSDAAGNLLGQAGMPSVRPQDLAPWFQWFEDNSMGRNWSEQTYANIAAQEMSGQPEEHEIGTTHGPAVVGHGPSVQVGGRFGARGPVDHTAPGPLDEYDAAVAENAAADVADAAEMGWVANPTNTAEAAANAAAAAEAAEAEGLGGGRSATEAWGFGGGVGGGPHNTQAAQARAQAQAEFQKSVDQGDYAKAAKIIAELRLTGIFPTFD